MSSFGRFIKDLTSDLNLFLFFFYFAEARGKVKKILLPLLLAMKIKMAVILPIVLKVIALISLKGLFAGTLALIFSGKTNCTICLAS